MNHTQKCAILAFALFSFALSVSAQRRSALKIKWDQETSEFASETTGRTYKIPICFGCSNLPENEFLPVHGGLYPIEKGNTASDVQLNIISSEPLGRSEISLPDNITTINESFFWELKEERGIPVVVYRFNPIARVANGSVVRVLEYELIIRQTRKAARPKAATFASNSVLAQGDWYKIGLVEDGIYRITKDDLDNLGIDVNTLNPQDLNIYGNGYGQLPFDNSVDRPDDLQANNILVVDGNDGSFDEEDYILFFGKGPHKWNYNADEGLFDHIKHDYSDTSYYFIGIDPGTPPVRLSNLSSSGSSPNFEVTTFNDYSFHEVDRENMLKSGRIWYGEKFDVQTVYNFSGENFTFPNILPDVETVVRVDLLSRRTVSGTSSRFTLSVNGMEDTDTFGSVGTSNTSLFGVTKPLEVRTSGLPPALNINITYEQNLVPSATGWLNYININTRRRLRMAGNQMIFRDINSVEPNGVARFTLTNANSVSEIWEITDPTQARRLSFTRTGDALIFTLPTPELREFIAFSGGYLSPSLFGRVNNQNLHALGLGSPVDMVIVSPAGLLSQAEALADIHRNYTPDPLNVEVVELSSIYNEFSSGMRDVTAIKWLMKMLYDRANGIEEQMPKYLLLFGDGSFDNKSSGRNNSNLIPTYQSLNSLSGTNSYVSDDYFGLLSDDEGEGLVDLMDIGVGRLTVKNFQEATSVVNKIRRYMEIDPIEFTDGCSVCGDNSTNLGAWRNIIALVADDEDGNEHMSNSRTISNQINEYTGRFNLERIFADAYPQVATPGGQRYPEVNAAIDRRVRNGAFIVNYIGHGGGLGWAQERILDVPTILDWNNAYQMPIFMTATCEFSRFDDPVRVSAGEHVLLNGNGGGIALLTTTRLVYSSPNFRLNQEFYEALFNRPETEMVTRLGDVSRETKNGAAASSNGSSNHRNFSLLGDPALPLALPKHQVDITAITDTLGNAVDTLKALGVARIQGEVRSEGGQLLNAFNGRVSATVYDRIVQRTTLANDGESSFTFPAQENIVYRGNAEVINGQFTFDFVIPKDISFAVDSTARISLYAFNETEDATGFRNNLNIGDRDPNAVDDGSGPEVEAFLNDENFVFGGYTNSTPVLVAKVFDNNGINTVGTGIGHDITAVLDGDPNKSIVLNDYYESDLNTYKSGRVQYQFDELEPGEHQLELKVWDVHNNSSVAKLEFLVSENDEFMIDRVLNYPNPFTTRTDFYFEHNQSCDFLNVLIQVYTVSGKLVKSINTVSNTDGFRNEPIPWDGRDDYGDRLATGVYVYKMSVRNPAGEQVEKFEKLVILN